MSKEEIDEIAWRIMLENTEYNELDRIFAINGIIASGYFDNLDEEGQEDVVKRLAIGIQAFNAQIKQTFDDHRNWRKLPDIKVSGNDS